MNKYKLIGVLLTILILLLLATAASADLGIAVNACGYPGVRIMPYCKVFIPILAG
jgi:hypothetical protein